MTDEATIARALAIIESAVQDMAEEGIGPIPRAVALACHMRRQAELATPTTETATAVKIALALS